MQPVELDATLCSVKPLVLHWVHSANVAVESRLRLWATTWKDRLTDPETAASISTAARARHACDDVLAPVKGSLAPQGSDCADGDESESVEAGVDDEPDEAVYRGALDDVFDDAATDPASVELAEDAP